MIVSFSDLKRKDVVSVRDGTRLGYVGDVEMDTKRNIIVSVTIYGRLKWFGLLGREDDITIDWEKISIIGEDTILVNYESKRRCRNRSQFSFLE